MQKKLKKVIGSTHEEEIVLWVIITQICFGVFYQNEKKYFIYAFVVSLCHKNSTSWTLLIYKRIST